MKRFFRSDKAKFSFSFRLCGAVSGVAMMTIATPFMAAAAAAPAAISSSIATQGFTSTLLYDLGFSTAGADPSPKMTLGGDGRLYAATSSGGANGFGAVFRIDSAEHSELVHTFTASEGNPWSTRFPLARGPDGSLYGATGAVAYDSGTLYNTASIVYRIDPQGNYQVLHSFAPTQNGLNWPIINADGIGPGRVGVAADGTVYGIEGSGGPAGDGTAFKIDRFGVFTLLHVFSTAVDYQRWAVSADGNMCGLTSDGGFYRIAPDGSYSTVDSVLASNFLTGSDGAVYGYWQGSVGSNGRVFHVSTCGTQELLYAPQSASGDVYFEIEDLVAGKDGNLYAVQAEHHAPAFGLSTTIESIVQITPSGQHKVLHRFDAPTITTKCRVPRRCYDYSSPVNWDGEQPRLLAGEDGAIYGNARGGASGGGTVFKLMPDGRFTLLGTWSFGSTTPPDGQEHYIGEFSFPGFAGDDGQGHLFSWINFGENPTIPFRGLFLYRLSPNGPMTITASFTPASAAPGQAVTLAWAASGAAACWLDTDIGGSGLLASTSGSLALTPTLSTALPITRLDNWVANVQCKASDGSVSGVALKLPRKWSTPGN